MWPGLPGNHCENGGSPRNSQTALVWSSSGSSVSLSSVLPLACFSRRLRHLAPVHRLDGPMGCSVSCLELSVASPSRHSWCCSCQRFPQNSSNDIPYGNLSLLGPSWTWGSMSWTPASPGQGLICTRSRDPPALWLQDRLTYHDPWGPRSPVNPVGVLSRRYLWNGDAHSLSLRAGDRQPLGGNRCHSIPEIQLDGFDFRLN